MRSVLMRRVLVVSCLGRALGVLWACVVYVVVVVNLGWGGWWWRGAVVCSVV